MTTMLALSLTLWAVVGTLVVLTEEPVRQAVLASVLGLIMAVAFFVLRAPDVAFSELVVSAVALPAMLLLAIAKVREQGDAREREREEVDTE